MVKYLSGRQKLRPSDRLTEDRYQYLGLDQAEPNLADPATSPGVPSGLQYQLVAVTGYEGRRYWVPVGGSLQPGAITIFDEGTPVSSASSITQMNFVGAAVTAQVSLQNPSGHPGIAATVTVIPVTVGDSPPIGVGVTNNGELWWESDTGDLYVYYDDGNSSQWVMANAGGRGLTGDKGEAGDKGQKGDTGLTGGVGDKGEKGAPSTVAGPDGDKGQKGEIGVGDKGQKGEDGVKGESGDKGQKGEIGVGTKGDKGDGSAGGAQVTISDTAPTSPAPSNGDLWWESDTFDLHVYYEDGSSNQWVSITSNAALKGEKGDKGEVAQKGQKGEGANVATSPNPPSSPDAGDLWWDTDDGDLHVYFNDGNSSQWVNTSGVGAKGQKGDVEAQGNKGQKGEIGAGSPGDKGQKGEDNSTKGQKGEVGTGDKGQKGEEGSSGSSDVRSMNMAVSSGESNTSSYNFSDKLSLSINTTSTSRVLVHYAFEIKQSSTNNVYCTGRVNGTNTSFVGGSNQNLDFTESQSGYVRHNGSILDVGTYSGTRTYKIQFANGTQGGSSTGYSYIRNATLVITEMTI